MQNNQLKTQRIWEENMTKVQLKFCTTLSYALTGALASDTSGLPIRQNHPSHISRTITQ